LVARKKVKIRNWELGIGKEQGRRKKEEGRRGKEEGRRKKEEGGRKKEVWLFI